MISKQQFQKYAEDPSAFRDDLRVDVNGSVRRFGDVQDPWQAQDFQAMDSALMRSNGRGDDKDAKMRVFLERPRGHSKTTDLATTCLYAMVFATRPLKIYGFAADRDQANLLKDSIQVLVRLNPWISEILQVQKGFQVLNIAKGHPGFGSRLEISASDVGSSYGILPDAVICDELCHWGGEGQLFHSALSSAAKRENCLLVIISNAGFQDSWQWKVREQARTDEDWTFSRLDGPQASWLDQKRLDEQRRMLPPTAYARLWENQWASAGGDALLPSDIEAAFDDTLKPMTGNEQGFIFCAGLDLGLKRDNSALVVLAVEAGGKSNRIRLAHHKVWTPPPGSKINLLEVERHILETDAKFQLEFIAYDPWQAELLAQRLEADTAHKRRNERKFFQEPWMREIPATPSNLRQQASLTIESFTDRRFKFYECEPLRRDLNKVRAEETNYQGFKLTSPRDEHGHGDTFSAFALALLIAHELAGKKPVVAGSLGKEHSYLEAFSQRQREHESEQEWLSKPDDSNGLVEAMHNGQVQIFGERNPFSQFD